MVFTALSKLMLLYLEQQGNPCLSFRDQYYGNLGFEPNFLTKREKEKKHKCYLYLTFCLSSCSECYSGCCPRCGSSCYSNVVKGEICARGLFLYVVPSVLQLKLKHNSIAVLHLILKYCCKLLFAIYFKLVLNLLIKDVVKLLFKLSLKLLFRCFFYAIVIPFFKPSPKLSFKLP